MEWCILDQKLDPKLVTQAKALQKLTLINLKGIEHSCNSHGVVSVSSSFFADGDRRSHNACELIFLIRLSGWPLHVNPTVCFTSRPGPAQWSTDPGQGTSFGLVVPPTYPFLVATVCYCREGLLAVTPCLPM